MHTFPSLTFLSPEAPLPSGRHSSEFRCCSLCHKGRFACSHLAVLQAAFTLLFQRYIRCSVAMVSSN